MRSDRVLRRATPPRVYQPLGGRPAKHGGEFVFGDPATWDVEQAVTHTDTRLYGQVHAQAWDRLRPRLTRRGLGRPRRGVANHRRDGHPAHRRPFAKPRGAEAALVGVVQGRRHASGCRPVLAGVPAPLRHRAHIPPAEADARLDRTASPRAGRRGPLDLAGAGRAYSAALGPTPRHRSTPTATVIPVLTYPDVREAVDRLSAAFGFAERVRIGENHRAQLRFGDGALIVADVHGDRRPPRSGEVTHSVMVRVDDARAHCEGARAHPHGAGGFRVRRAAVQGRGSGGPRMDLLRDPRRPRTRGVGAGRPFRRRSSRRLPPGSSR